MKLYKYKNYQEYKDVQEAGNIRKINNVWVSKKVIDLICHYIKINIKSISFGLCHGTRNGVEQKCFIDNLGINVLGTEISSTANNFPNTIQWDFHNIKEEWIGNVDFIYSNSIDHSYNPKKAIRRWMACLKDDGILFLEHTKRHSYSSRLDPFGSTTGEIKKLLKKFGQIIDILKITDRHGLHNVKTNFRVYVVRKKMVEK